MFAMILLLILIWALALLMSDAARYMQLPTMRKLIKFYFNLGLAYSEIMCCLAFNHHIVISIRTLKRRLAEMNLFRKRDTSDIVDVALYITEQLSQSSCQIGYRLMHRRCLLAGFRVSRADIASLLSILDPQGCELRKKKKLRRRKYYSRGPNFLWHIDSYDKLKPYGLCINGCIDGFSRKIIWCKITCSTSNPRIIAGHYIDAIQNLNACPKKVRGDRGTENKYVAEMQTFLTGHESFIYGPSTGNQRIESFWRQLRNGCCQFWIEFFGVLRETGRHFDGSSLDLNLIQLIFMPIVQRDIDEALTAWNTHCIRPSNNQNVPSGRPCILYTIPYIYGADDYGIEADPLKTSVCKDECLLSQNKPSDSDIHDLLLIIMEENDLCFTMEIEEALSLYKTLRRLTFQSLTN